jgi:hypothetical protein
MIMFLSSLGRASSADAFAGVGLAAPEFMVGFSDLLSWVSQGLLSVW